MSMTVNDSTMEADGQNKVSASTNDILATSLMENLGRTSEICAKSGSAAVSTNSNAKLSIFFDVVSFNPFGKNSYVGNFL